MHLIVIEIIVGVEYFRDGVIDTGQDLFFVSSHALHALLGHESAKTIFKTMKNFNFLKSHRQFFPLYYDK